MLLDQTVELARFKDKVSKMEISLKEKSADIKKLHRKISYYEHVLKTKTLEDENTEIPTIQENKQDDHNSNVRDFLKFHHEKP